MAYTDEFDDEEEDDEVGDDDDVADASQVSAKSTAYSADPSVDELDQASAGFVSRRTPRAIFSTPANRVPCFPSDSGPQ